jgi:hypothetical protein
METTARFLNGVYPFEGKGLDAPYPLADALTYTVPADKRAAHLPARRQLLRRAGQPDPHARRQADAAVPGGRQGGSARPARRGGGHLPEAKIEVFVAAPQGASGQVVLDVGIMEV